jgi:hypothetical protein
MKILYTIILMSIVIPLFANDFVGKVISLEGRGFIQKENSSFKKLKLSDSLENGDLIKTSNSARIKISFIDNSIISIAPNSQIKIEKYVFDKTNKERASVLNLLGGRVKLLVAKLSSKKRDFTIKTGTATVGVRGTEFIVSNENVNESEILVISGSVEVINPLDESKKSILLSKNDIVKSIGKLPLTSATKASESDIQRLTMGLSIPTMIKIRLDYSKLLKNVKLNKLLNKNKLELDGVKKKKKRTDKKKRRVPKRNTRVNFFKNGYVAPSSVNVKVNINVKGE